jgi:hypothetical protein
MTFDEAVEHPGPLLAAWELTVRKGERTLTLFSLAEDRARALAHRGARAGEEDAAVAPLHARGIPIGACDGFCDFAWLDAADGITVWRPDRRVLQASGDTLALADGRRFARTELERVYAWADDDYLERGVRARLRCGEEVTLARDVSAVAAANPTYSRNELLYEAEWAGAIAAAVAAWAGIPYENRI